MAIIGTFTPTKDGGWTGSIHTLTINAKLRLLPSDSRDNPQAPAFRVFAGTTRVGDAWEARTSGTVSKNYLRVRLDDPSLPAPVTAALFFADNGEEAQLVWNRQRTS